MFTNKSTIAVLKRTTIIDYKQVAYSETNFANLEDLSYRLNIEINDEMSNFGIEEIPEGMFSSLTRMELNNGLKLERSAANEWRLSWFDECVREDGEHYYVYNERRWSIDGN